MFEASFCETTSVIIYFITAVINISAVIQVHPFQMTKESSKLPIEHSKSPAGYLNPELYREGIASLVHAKEQAEDMMFRNDVIAQLVTEMPYHDIQNRLLISGNHKEVNFENDRILGNIFITYIII